MNPAFQHCISLVTRHLAVTITTLFIVSTDLPVYGLDVHKDCDIPTENLKSIAAKNADECAKACTDEAACKAFVFISGWNRCQLKKSFKKTFKITMHAAEKTDAGSFTMVKKRHDHRGKDMKRIDGVANDTTCLKHCSENAKCQSFVFISGYDTCWLKSNRGEMFEKIFYCGRKPE